MIMPSASKLFVLLINIYFNLAMINPCLENIHIFRYDVASTEIFNFNRQNTISPEQKIDLLMQEYVRSLYDVKNVKEDKKAIALMHSVRVDFLKKASKIEPELKSWLSSLPDKQVAIFRERMLLKPYFKQINDITFSMNNKMEKKPEMKQSFEAMDDFFELLYN
jgi:hypothetical protein